MFYWAANPENATVRFCGSVNFIFPTYSIITKIFKKRQMRKILFAKKEKKGGRLQPTPRSSKNYGSLAATASINSLTFLKVAIRSAKGIDSVIVISTALHNSSKTAAGILKNKQHCFKMSQISLVS